MPESLAKRFPCLQLKSETILSDRRGGLLYSPHRLQRAGWKLQVHEAVHLACHMLRKPEARGAPLDIPRLVTSALTEGCDSHKPPQTPKLPNPDFETDPKPFSSKPISPALKGTGLRVREPLRFFCRAGRSTVHPLHGRFFTAKKERQAARSVYFFTHW